MKGAKASNERNEANLKQATCRGSTFLRNNSFFPYLKKQHKSRDKGYIYRQTFAAILQFYFLFFYIFMYTSFLASQFCVRIQFSGNREEFEKSKFTKTGVNITIVYTFTENPLSASAVKSQETKYICEQHINTTSNISMERTTFAKSEDPEKTNTCTVKMMEAKCHTMRLLW